MDEISVPPEERTFYAKLHQLGPDYEILIVIQESEWVPRAIEHVRVFIHEHDAVISAVGGYILKTVTDLFKSWAVDRLRQAPKNTEKLTIYGPDNKPLKTVTVTREKTEES